MQRLFRKPHSDLNIARSGFGAEVRRRVPWIFFSVLAGIVMIQISQTYEESFSKNIQLVFFIPMIVYMSDSIGTETLALFVRELALRQVSVKRLVVKEVFVGLSLGGVSGLAMGVFCYFWLSNISLAVAVALAMTVNGLIAVLVGMLTPIFFSKLGRDPALGTDEITTAVSDNLSMLIYLVVATLILF